MTTSTPIRVSVIFLSFHLLCMSQDSEAVSSGKLVTYLPGLAVQPLPFHLETGYIGVGSRSSKSSTQDDVDGFNQLFYYFVKSERNPKEDPLVLWLTGGPRCSEFSALAIEIGPIYIDKVVQYNNGSIPTLSLNPNSWTKIANIIFLDEPVGTGFSHSKSSHESTIGDLESAENTYEFLIKWLTQNPEFRSNPLYISGDSYSGIIVPIIVQDLIRDIDNAKYPFLNFKGYTLGNPVTDARMEENAKVQFAYNLGFISYELYQLISGINQNQVMEPLCNNSLITIPQLNWMTNYRRRRVFWTGIYLHCYVFEKKNYGSVLFEYWANNDVVQKALHVRKGTIKKWVRCNSDLQYKMEVTSSIEYYQNISSRGYRYLIYSGDHDMMVPHISTKAWIRSLTNLTIAEDWRLWNVKEQVAGYTVTFSNGLTYATVKGGGHTAPEYKPEECYGMFERWISNTLL
ncbi:serine carboxypeptidase-like 13 [Papaver somniferum]|uniref:serine carboxypeptidase-like 13 n=1 Tax=Papaver somniferum TaxID=3469 RepID=UPI000E700E32|nr:serine carboxypeptidase-like 13 [Papaver somniferum]